jgi:hypothetical protein
MGGGEGGRGWIGRAGEGREGDWGVFLVVGCWGGGLNAFSFLSSFFLLVLCWVRDEERRALHTCM